MRPAVKLFLLTVSLLFTANATAQQGVIGDVLSGKLVKPKVGQWVWYELTDAATGRRFSLRQAIVDKEKVKRKTGYWVEMEIIPQLGYRSVYKLLLTGPAGDPEHVHRVIVREGRQPPREIPLPENPQDSPPTPEPERRPLGKEEVETGKGPIEAEHIEIVDGDKTSEVWVNDDVRPMGIVRMQSADGELVLRDYGEGGENARSVMDDDPGPAPEAPATTPRIEVRVGHETEKVETEEASPAPESDEDASTESTQ